MSLNVWIKQRNLATLSILQCPWQNKVQLKNSKWLNVKDYKRLSIIRVNWEIWCCTVGMRSCAIAVHFCPHGFALPLLVALPLVCPTPTHLLVHGGRLCLGKYTYSPLRISVWQVPGARVRLPWLPLFICILPTLAHCLLCCQFAPTLYYRQVNVKC